MRPTLRPVRAAVAAAIAAVAAAIAALLVLTGVASAVQTDDFGLAATGNRTALEFPAGSSPVTDTIEVYNRTPHRIAVTLGTIGATRKPDGTFTYGGAGQGLAADITLSTLKVTLGPHSQQVVTVTVRRPGQQSTDEWAAITAVEQTGTQAGVAVRQRLALFVGVLARGSGNAGSGNAGSGNAGGNAAGTGSHHSSSTGRWVAVAVAVLLAAGGLIAFATRARRRLPA